MKWLRLFESFNNGYEEVNTPGYLGGDDYGRITNDIDKLISYLEENWELFTDKEIKEIEKIIPSIDIRKSNLDPNWRSIYQASEEQKKFINKYFYLSTPLLFLPGPSLNIYKTKDEWYWVCLNYRGVVSYRHSSSIIYKCDQFDGLLNFLRDGVSFLFLEVRDRWR